MNKFNGFLLASALALPGCVHSWQPDLTSSVEVDASAAVSMLGETDTEGWYGTGWYIASDGNTSILATAGHVCNQPGSIVSGGFVSFQVQKVDYKTSDGQTAYAVYDHDVQMEHDDVCLMFVNHAAPSVLQLAYSSPTKRDRVHYVGFPHGTMGAYDGYVMGTSSEGYTAIAVAGYGGASGSAVVNDDGQVIGMLVAGDPTFPEHAWLVPLETLRAAKRYADQFLFEYHEDPFTKTQEILAGKEDKQDGPTIY